MADSYEKRKRRKGRFDFGAREDSFIGHSQTPVTVKSPMPMKILGLAKPTKAPTEVPSPLKPDNEGNDQVLPEGTVDKGPVTVLSDPRHHLSQSSKISGDGGLTENVRSSSSIPTPEGVHLSDNNSTYTQLRRPAVSMTGTADPGLQSPHAKLAPPTEKQSKTKLIDESLHWIDAGLDLMLDQTDFLVVGVIGLQGCGKSTILSLLAGNSQQDAYRNYIFPPQSKEIKEDCTFQTGGIDMFVTPERVIYLDCQPLLSPAIMDCLIRYEKKLPSDYSSLQNLVEMQSMQLLTFLLSVCNIVLIVDDWFIDVNLLRFIQDAEMLKPSQPSSVPSSENQSHKEESTEFFPTVVFVHNKASREDFSPQAYHSMQTVLHSAFSSSKLRYKTGINMSSSLNEPVIQGIADSDNVEVVDTNLIMIPLFEFYKCDPECLETTLPDYRGYPSFSALFSFFRSQVLSAPRSPLTHSALSEKNWFHFAARIWDSVKKSSLLAEYNRLLSTS